jgi:hypothetical protein
MGLHLKEVRPRRGQDLLKMSLDERPAELIGGITVEEVEIIVEYGLYT